MFIWEALHTVKGVEDNYLEMFKRLDAKYGEARKLVDAIIFDIQKIKPVPEGDTGKFINMVEVVERSWLELQRLGMPEEMNTTTMVTMVEKLLPSTQKREWVTKMDNEGNSSTIGHSTFQRLLSYLLQQKRVMEYMENDVRLNSIFNRRHINQTVNSAEVNSSNCDYTNTNTNANTNTKDTTENDVAKMYHQIQSMTERMENLFKNHTGIKNQVRQDTKFTHKKQISDVENRACWIHRTDTHPIYQCKMFINSSHDDKLRSLRQNGACFNCLQQGHIAASCPVVNQCDKLNQLRQKCGKRHHPHLHIEQRQASDIPTRNPIYMASSKRQENLLAVSHLCCHDRKLVVMWDSGANVSLITHKAASLLNLKGPETKLTITKVGNQVQEFKSRRYNVPLHDINGKLWTVHAYGIEEITSELDKFNVSSVASLFRNIQPEDIERPYGKVDMLIGIDCCAIMQIVVETVGNLQLLRNQFGYCIRGCVTEDIAPSGQVQIMRGSKICDVNNISVESMTSLKKKLDEYFTVENLGTCCSPRCGGCKCGKCATGTGSYSLQEEREMSLIKEGLIYNAERRKFIVHYPWIRDPNELPNNVTAAEARLRTTERRLLKMGTDYAKAYDDQIRDMLARGVARKLSREEVLNFKGPIHYLCHHEVLKPDSASTPLRIVFNSSIASYMGHVLNDYWAKGPDVINNLFGILLRFREEPVGLVGDISKMFNTIELAERDQHVHRFLWRNMNFNQEPTHFIMLAVAFGDRPSGTISMLALKSIAEMNKNGYEKAAKLITRNSYEDDLIQSVPRTEDALCVAENVQDILERGGFKIKHWIMSGDDGVTEIKSDITLLNVDQEKVLGMRWVPKTDHFIFQVRINFSPRQKKIPTGPDVTEVDIDAVFPKILTRRMVLSQAARIYDPLGFIAPVTLKAKILLRTLVSGPVNEHKHSAPSGWDDPIPEEGRKAWLLFFKDLYKLKDVAFPRCLKPKEAIDNPILIIFSDASIQAYGACAYVQWKLSKEKYDAQLIAAKHRIAPVRQLTIPRLELCAAVLGCRLRETIEREMQFTYQAVFHIVDSAIVRAQIQKESYGFGSFVATKIAEIQNKSDAREWWWIATSDNPADMVTRSTSPTQIGSRSMWQRGPNFLQLPVDQWPISQAVQDQELPDRIGVHIINIDNQSEETGIGVVINVDKFNSYSKLLRVTARLVELRNEKKLSAIGKSPTAEHLLQAEAMWVKHIQRDLLQSDWQNRFKRLGPSISDDGVIVVGKRMARWLKDNWNQDAFVLLPAKHRFTQLFIQHVHASDHAGVDVTLAKVQRKFWVPGARKIIKQIKNDCVTCRKIDKRLQTQIMGELGPERLQPSPAFYHTSLDLFGPFLIRDTVKKRTRTKAYGLIFSCMATRAVYLDLVEGYSTADFLITFRRFVTIRGYPASIHSDNGSQLVAANKQLRNMSANLDWFEICQSGASKGLTWTFNTSADAPWQNGCSESLIRLVKRALMIAVGDSVLTAGELQTALFEVANLLNERPIGRKPGADPQLGSYLCPNDLLLGRTGITVPQGPWATTTNICHRQQAIQRVVTAFWKKWQRDYFSTLLIRQKWHVEKRNLKPGDIVLVQDKNAIRGHWRLAEVIEALVGQDGKVRNVTLRYKCQSHDNTGSSTRYTGQSDTIITRSVHRLVLILEAEDQVAAIGGGSV